jgi:hypothetical protein
VILIRWARAKLLRGFRGFAADESRTPLRSREAWEESRAVHY